MAPPRPRPRAEERSTPGWVWAAGGLLGLVSVGYGAWRALAPREAPAVVSAATPGNAPASPAPPAGGGATPIVPGTVSLRTDAPAATSAPASSAPCPGCDIVLLTVCSLRRDYVGVYGEHPGLTPSIDSLARGGYHFSRAYAASNFTLASLTAVLTGRFGSSTGVLGWDKGLVEDVRTLPEVLGFYGYRTGAFTIDAPSGFRPDYGLHRGFQRMQVTQAPRDTPDGRFQPGAPGPGGASADTVVAWIAEQPRDKPLFAMFHTRSAHFPFVIDDSAAAGDSTGISQMLWEAGRVTRTAGKAMPGMAGGTAQQGVVEIVGPDPLQVRVNEVGAPAVAAWRARYAESVARMDLDVKRVTEALRARGRLDRTIVLLVGDHGESLNDHGELLHGDAYWDSVVNVPLVLRVPGLPGSAKPVTSLVAHPDILPTLLELVGAMPPAGIDGVSMLPLLRGEAETVRTMALVEGGVARQLGPHARGAVVAPPWTLLRQERGCGGDVRNDPPRTAGEPATCLYDVRTDPGQDRNVAREHPEVVRDLLSRWDAFRAARGREGAALALDPRYVEELQRNGYDFRPDTPEQP